MLGLPLCILLLVAVCCQSFPFEDRRRWRRYFIWRPRSYGAPDSSMKDLSTQHEAPSHYALEEDDAHPHPKGVLQPRGYYMGTPLDQAPTQEDSVKTPSLPAQASREWAPRNELEPFPVNGGDEAASPAGGNDGSSGSADEHYVIITRPSGFQTRYVAKSFNRFQRGRKVFSQTTYIPLDVLSPVVPDPHAEPEPEQLPYERKA